MIILSKSDPWPEVVISETSYPKSFHAVVGDGIARWMYRRSDRPTTLLVGPTAKHYLQHEVADMPMRTMSAPEIKTLENRNGGLAEYMGMTIHWTTDEGLHLLKD